jgi:hypothetical protein
MNTKPSLLFLAHRIPYPPTKGEKLRAFNLLKGLSETHDIWLGAPLDDPEDWQHRTALDPWCVDTHIADIRGRTRHRAALEAIARSEPVSYAYFRERGMMDWVKRVTGERQFDTVFLYSSGAAPYLKAIQRAPRSTIIDFVDVDSEKWRALGESAKGPMKHVYTREAKLLRAEETRLGALSDANLLVTRAEADLYTELTGQPAEVVGNGVDTEYWGAAKSLPSAGSPPRSCPDCVRRATRSSSSLQADDPRARSRRWARPRTSRSPGGSRTCAAGLVMPTSRLRRCCWHGACRTRCWRLWPPGHLS